MDFVSQLEEPWVKTVLSLILPCMVFFLVIRIALISIARSNRRIDEGNQQWALVQQAEEQARAQATEAAEARVCVNCGVKLEGDKRLCPECGTLNP